MATPLTSKNLDHQVSVLRETLHLVESSHGGDQDILIRVHLRHQVLVVRQVLPANQDTQVRVKFCHLETNNLNQIGGTEETFSKMIRVQHPRTLRLVFVAHQF